MDYVQGSQPPLYVITLVLEPHLGGAFRGESVVQIVLGGRQLGSGLNWAKALLLVSAEPATMLSPRDRCQQHSSDLGATGAPNRGWEN